MYKLSVENSGTILVLINAGQEVNVRKYAQPPKRDYNVKRNCELKLVITIFKFVGGGLWNGLWTTVRVIIQKKFRRWATNQLYQTLQIFEQDKDEEYPLHLAY